MQRIEDQLRLLVEAQVKTTEAISVVNRRMMGFEQTVGLMRRYTQETLTYVKRIQPYIEKAMKTLHEAFRLVANGIWNLREETSEFAGNIISSNLDIKIV
jgi:hypothetical protein